MESRNNLQLRKSIFHRWWFWLVAVIGLLAIAMLYFAFPPTFYLPHKIPSIILPIDPKYDSVANIMPMGEKIEHPDSPSGHPGIDFGFRTKEKVPYIASMDGTVKHVSAKDFEEKVSDMTPITKKQVDVTIESGTYQTVYSEMDFDTLSPNIKRGAKVKQGDFIGYGNMQYSPREGTLKEMIHWEFGSISPLIDRFCPMEYFTAESRSRIESIWAQTDWTDMKSQYPKICNGNYDGKYER